MIKSYGQLIMKTEQITTKDITPLARHFNMYADSYLVLGRRAGRRGYVVAWQSRHSDKIEEYYKFPRKKDARDIFNDMCRKNELPCESPVCDKDWQKQTLYDWEDEYLIPHSTAITEDCARKLIRKISREQGIRAPNLIWGDHINHSKYNENDHAIEFGHRDLISLLHEMAHALNIHRNGGEPSPHHAPSFVWAEIELCHRYAELDLPYMVMSAQKYSLLGDTEFPRPTPQSGPRMP